MLPKVGSRICTPVAALSLLHPTACFQGRVGNLQLLRRPHLPRRKQAPSDLIPELSDNPGRGRDSPRPRSWAGSAVHLLGFSLAQCAGVQRKTNQNQNHAPKEPLASTKWRWSTRSDCAWRCGGRVLMPRARQEDSESPQSAREHFLSRFSGREHPELWLKGLVGSPAPCELPRLPVSPTAFPGGRWGAQRGWGTPGCRAGLSRAPHPRHCGGSSNQSAPGGSSWAGTTRLGGGGWAAVT